LQALKMLERSSEKGVQDKDVAEMVNKIAGIVDGRIERGEADIKKEVAIGELFGSGAKIEDADLLKVNVVIPKGATIAIVGENSARSEMQAAAKKQGVSFSEPEINEKEVSSKKRPSTSVAGAILSTIFAPRSRG
jgi:hypothetical protein